jgi:nucleoside-diphosphate-sugar epimerase
MGEQVLIVGGAGYVGSVLATRLLRDGFRVRVLDLLMHGGQPLLGHYADPGFSFVHADVRDRAAVQSALQHCHAVVLLAAVVGDPACARQPELAKSINVEGALQVVELAKAAEVKRVVFASTCSNYGRMKDPAQLVTEESELAPVSLYAETKVQVEKALLREPKDGATAFTVLRFATVFGLSPRMRFDLTVNEFTMEALVKKKLVIYGEQFWRPYLHTTDAAAAISLVLSTERAQVAGEVFNVGDTSQNFTKGQLVEMILGHVGKDAVQVEFVKKVEDPRDYRVSFAKVNERLGFRTQRTVPDGIREIAGAIRQGVFTDFNDSRYRN